MLLLYPFTVSLVPLHTYYPIISDIMYGFILTVHYFGDEISPKLERNLNKKTRGRLQDLRLAGGRGK